MSLYHPNLSIMPADPVDACHVAMEHGRQLALDDLNAHPDRDAGYYAQAAASYVYATLMPNARKHMLVKMSGNPMTAGSSKLTPADFVEHELHLDEPRNGLGLERCAWACYVQDIAVGIAQVADGLIRADGDDRGCLGPSAQDFVFQFVHAMPEHNHIGTNTPVVRPVNPSSRIADSTIAAKAVHDIEGAVPGLQSVNPPSQIAQPTTAIEMAVSPPSLIDQWLDAKSCFSRAERSRQGSSARLLLEAVSLTEATAERLAEIDDAAVDRFIEYAAAFPLAPRGERSRIAHVKSFITYVKRLHTAAPGRD